MPMKALLGCLMCLVLTLSQVFAISGGPFSGGGRVAVTGTYAGVLVPTVDPTIGLADNSLALFTMKIPQTGLGSGTSAVFRNGFFYPGTIDASADPDRAQITGIVRASFEVNGVVLFSGSRSITAIYYASGSFANAKVKASNSSSFSSGSVRLAGTASLTYTNVKTDGSAPDPNGDSGGPVHYSIQGFKQSNSTN